MQVVTTLALFLATALAEILGCYLPWLWLRQGRSAWLLLPAAARAADPAPAPLIYLSPQGKPLTQKRARELAALPRMILLCGRYVEMLARQKAVRGVEELGKALPALS